MLSPRDVKVEIERFLNEHVTAEGAELPERELDIEERGEGEWYMHVTVAFTNADELDVPIDSFFEELIDRWCSDTGKNILREANVEKENDMGVRITIPIDGELAVTSDYSGNQYKI